MHPREIEKLTDIQTWAKYILQEKKIRIQNPVTPMRYIPNEEDIPDATFNMGLRYPKTGKFEGQVFPGNEVQYKNEEYGFLEQWPEDAKEWGGFDGERSRHRCWLGADYKGDHHSKMFGKFTTSFYIPDGCHCLIIRSQVNHRTYDLHPCNQEHTPLFSVKHRLKVKYPMGPNDPWSGEKCNIKTHFAWDGNEDPNPVYSVNARAAYTADNKSFRLRGISYR